MTLTIIGLGPGDPDDISRRAWRIMENATIVYLRTKRHPCVPHLPAQATYISFDDVYDTTEQFEKVYDTITQRLIDAATHDDIIYAVPGDPFIAESTVTKIIEQAQVHHIDVQIVNGISFIEPTCAALGIDALDGLQLVDALEVAAMYHPPINPDKPVLLAQVYSREVASNLKLTLMNQYPDDFEVTLVHSAGANGLTETIPIYEIDRSEHINHLTSLYVPAIGGHSSFEALQEIIAHLRAPEGCPWDQAQTHESLRPYLLEETYEVLDTLNQGDMEALADEMGDLLLQIVLHTQIAIEEGDFHMSQVLHNINQKMIRRHPHVWGDVSADNPDTVVTNWDAIKKQEKVDRGNITDGFTSSLDDVPAAFSAIMRAQKYAKKAAKLGFDYPDIHGVRGKIHEELAELDNTTTLEEQIDEAGDLVFAVIDLLRWLKIDAETALEAANAKFARRFQYVERCVYDRGKQISDYTLDELDIFWKAAKAEETSA